MIVYSKMNAMNNAVTGNLATPLRMIIEHESELLEKENGICKTLFNIEKSNRFAETIVGGNEFSEFCAVNEGDGPTDADALFETFSKFVEHIQFMKEFAISAEMIEDANCGIAASAKRRAQNFIRAYYKTIDRVCEAALIGALNSDTGACGASIDTCSPDGIPLFSMNHTWGHMDYDTYGTQSNLFKGNLFSNGDGVAKASILEEALYNLSVTMRNFKDESGAPLGYTADTIILPGNRPIAESIVKKVCGSYNTLANATNEINLHYNNWNIVILPSWTTEDDRLMLMSSEANRNLCGNMFFNRVPLTITNWVDNHTGNYIWSGRCRFGVGFGSYKHILLAFDSSAKNVPEATAF